MTKPQEIAPGVWYVGLNVANIYFVGTRESWIIVDTNMVTQGGTIRAAAESVFGAGAKPAAIVLTHAHFDHFGAAKELLEFYGDVPVYAHRLDAPYLTGRDKTAPGDPTVGGFFAFAYRAFPKRQGVDLSPWFHTLPDSELVPGVMGWRWFHTPGHTPGHVSLWRESDRVLIAGDAVITVNLDSLANVISKEPVVSRPPTPATPDWDAAEESVRLFAGLRPRVLVTGHGLPIMGDAATQGLEHLAQNFTRPKHGRYVAEAPRADEGGITYYPPPASDPVGMALGTVVIGGLIAWASHRHGSTQYATPVPTHIESGEATRGGYVPVAPLRKRVGTGRPVQLLPTTNPPKIVGKVRLIAATEPPTTVRGGQLVLSHP